MSGDRSAPGDVRPGGHQESPASRASRPPGSLAGVRVLVVDDDESSADYFAVALGASGAVVATAANATEAVRVLLEHRPGVVLTDIAMPGHDGYWLLRAIREHTDAAVRGVPVVATTAHGREHSRDRTLAAGFTDHLPKPVDPDELCAAIARAAGR